MTICIKDNSSECDLQGILREHGVPTKIKGLFQLEIENIYLDTSETVMQEQGIAYEISD